MDLEFKLILFSTDPSFIARAVAAGVDGIIVDWENIGKRTRQVSADTQINHDTLDDLNRVRKSTEAHVICRVNQWGSWIRTEIEDAIEAGANEILLPMVQTMEEVEGVLDQVNGRCGVGILVETRSAIDLAQDLGSLPLSRVYVGLNDLSIERGTSNIFTPLVDGTLETVRRFFPMPFGFGGLTLPELGKPIPCHLLIGEFARMDCQFSFLRRSFHRDIQGRDMVIEIPRIREALQKAFHRTPKEVEQDWRDLQEAVRTWPNPWIPIQEVSPNG
jgi:hypothetical protein